MATSRRGNPGADNRRMQKGAAGRSSYARSTEEFRSIPGGLAGTPRQPQHRQERSDKGLLSGAYSSTATIRARRDAAAEPRERGGRAERRSSSERRSAQERGTRPERRGTQERRTASRSNARRQSSRKAAVAGISPRRLKIIVALVAIVAVGALIYPAAREVYIANRSLEKANIQLAQVTERNAKIQASIDSLATDEGIEDFVREQYGWVKAGEHATIVKGLPENSTTTTLAKEVETEAAKPEQTPLDHVLDIIFFAGE